MTKYEWLESLCKDHPGKAPKVPFSAQETRGTFVLYATDLHSILRVPCSEEDAVKYSNKDPYLSGFFDTMKIIYDSTKFKGKLDAMLLKDMADNLEAYIAIDGAYFMPSVLRRALAGWEDNEAVWARAVMHGSHLLLGKKKIPVLEHSDSLHPLVLHGRHAMVVIAPVCDPGEEDPSEDFPESAITWT